MARMPELVVNLVLGDPEPVDGDLCHTCLLPALIAFPVNGLCPHGVMDAGRIIACTNCAEVTR